MNPSMSYNPIQNPWQIYDPDNEDPVNSLYDRSFSLPAKPPAPPKALIRHNGPIIPDWDPVIEEEGRKRKFGHKKTAPSFEKAPSHHKPIFSGPQDLKFSSISLQEFNQHPRTITAKSLKTLPTSPSNSNFDPFGMIQENLNKFIYTNIPKEYPSFIHCYLRRDKTGIQKGFFPTYYLHVERPSDGKMIFLLAARKVAKLNRQSEYLITTNIETLSEKSGGDGFVGKLRANGIKNSEYTLYDNGKSPNKYGQKKSQSKHGLRRELAGIIYHSNILGFKDSKEINAIIPKLEHDIQPTQDEDTILDRWRDSQFTDVIQLRNRSRDNAEGKKASMLQYTSNWSIQPSVKNFQMVIETENHEEELVMQFGRINSEKFICDFRYPLSPIQALGIALSSFDSGIA